MAQPATSTHLSAMIFMVLSAMCAAFFTGLFYDAYWKWLPIYEISGTEPIWWIFYADPFCLLIIPALFFSLTTLYYFQLIRKQH